MASSDFHDIQRIERFHLQVLRLLATGPIKSHLALKGGCNLRFFFGSIRYSVDMDLDIGAKVETFVLRKKMNRLLTGPGLDAALHTANLQITRVSAPKQTDTTQRWKIGLRGRAPLGPALHTKIEFSPRAASEVAVLEGITMDVLSTYQMLPLLVRHYPMAAALRQKVRALVGRSVVQARDVFDLAVLLTRAGPAARGALEPERALLPQAIERAMDVSFDDFQSRVVAYLDPAHADMYSSRTAWDALQERVVDALARAAP